MRQLVLHTTGRHTGEARVLTLYSMEDGPNLICVSSNQGSVEPPAWWLNLQADPAAEVEIEKQRRPVSARQATSEEAERLWPQLVLRYPHYDTYRRRTTREIAIVVLEPREAA